MCNRHTPCKKMLRVQILVGGVERQYTSFSDNARSSLSEAVEDLLDRTLENPDRVMVAARQDGPAELHLFVVSTEADFIDDDVCDYLRGMGPFAVHPLQPGILFFDGAVTVAFEMWLNL